MAINASVRIHLQLSGDITADMVFNMDNPTAAGIIFTQVVTGGIFNPIFNPLPIPGVILSGLMIIPPRDNIYFYNLVTDYPGSPEIQQSWVVFHPTKPSVFSISNILYPIKISHNGGTGHDIPFTFIWF
jgi:hypothetical protein